MLTFLQLLKAVVEIAGFALLGQAVLFLLAGRGRETNVFYRVIKTITSPVWRAVRFITPRFIADVHIGFLAFFLLIVAWFALHIGIVSGCAEDLRQPACSRLVEDYGKLCQRGVQDACDLLARHQLLLPAPAP